MTDYCVDRSTVLPLFNEGGRDAASPPHTISAGAWLSHPMTISTPQLGRQARCGPRARGAAARASGSAR